MLGITDGAKSIGLNTTTVAASTDELNKIVLPCILHWNQNHFVVLYSISKMENTTKLQILERD